MNLPNTRRARSAQACEACRKQKLACEILGDDKCKRCRRLNKDCTLHVPKVPAPRKQKPKTTPDSVTSQGSPPACPVSELDLLQGMLPNQDWSMVDWTTVRRDGPEYVDDFGTLLLDRLGMLGLNTGNERLRMLSWKAAEDLLDHYRNHQSPNFPFIIVPSTHSCHTMLESGKAPILLAIIAASSYTDATLQLTAETAFRHYMGLKTFIQSEASLVQFQAMLVFLAWHHYTYRPKMQQLYRSVQVLIENGLHDIVDEGTDQSLEARRALLGCYLLSTHGLDVSGMNRIPVYLYKSYYTECALKLHEAGQYPADKHFDTMIDLLRIVERIHSWRRQTIRTPSLDTSFTSHCMQELQAWAAKHNLHNANLDTKEQLPSWLTSTYYYSQIYLLDPTRPITNAEKSTTRTTTDFLAGVHACLSACERFFDHFVQARLPECSLLSITDWVHLLSGLVITIRLTVISRAHNEHERHVIKIDAILGTLIDYVNMCVKEPERHQTPVMLFQWHRGICVGLRRWLKREIPPCAFGRVNSPFETVKNLTIAVSSNDGKKFAQISGKDFYDELGEMMFPEGQHNANSNEGSDIAVNNEVDDDGMDFSVSDPMRDVIFDDSFFLNLVWSFPMGQA